MGLREAYAQSAGSTVHSCSLLTLTCTGLNARFHTTKVHTQTERHMRTNLHTPYTLKLSTLTTALLHIHRRGANHVHTRVRVCMFVRVCVWMGVCVCGQMDGWMCRHVCESWRLYDCLCLSFSLTLCGLSLHMAAVSGCVYLYTLSLHAGHRFFCTCPCDACSSGLGL